MGVCESEGPGADCGSVYTASVILALFPGQLMWRAGADWCAQLCTAAADLCETMLSVFPALHFSRRERVCAVLEDTHRMLVDLQRQTWADR
ncbi:hypothetical protein QQF64_007965 [Cirrhinus molitorella]|uniref:Uncharacterized protein n=1 Tax=Cirrhinus molitorella TaxID=172907 RepID=A0ABR3M4T5_9TELE